MASSVRHAGPAAVHFRSTRVQQGKRIDAFTSNSAQPAGWIELRRTSNGEAELLNLRVEHSSRKQGVGSGLVGHAVQCAVAEGISQLSLEARASADGMQQTALVGMYQKLGFRNAGFSRSGMPVMTRRLGVGPGTSIPLQCKRSAQMLVQHAFVEKRPAAPVYCVAAAGTPVRPGGGNVALRKSPVPPILSQRAVERRPAPPVYRPGAIPISPKLMARDRAIVGNEAVVQLAEWRTGTVDKQFQAAKQNSPNGFDTGHHKLSKSESISWFYKHLSSGQAITARERLDLPNESGVNAFKSLPSALTFGPPSGKRDGDPGQNRDLNYYSKPNLKRTLTPRSLRYNALEDLIGDFKARYKDDQTLSEQDFEQALTYLEQAEKLNAMKTGGALDTDESMWTQSGSKWKKTEVRDPKIIPDEDLYAEKRSVREIKSEQYRAVHSNPIGSGAGKEKQILDELTHLASFDPDDLSHFQLARKVELQEVMMTRLGFKF